MRHLSGGRRFIDRGEALVALEMPDVEPCRVCRPETGLTHLRRVPIFETAPGQRASGGAHRPVRAPRTLPRYGSSCVAPCRCLRSQACSRAVYREAGPPAGPSCPPSQGS
ncbi:DUF6233 domain-containing protein [Streptomyces bacillaris]|uniref:DUF6233 domain-containing protein n=1 Tax=Streptomyces bacillaris TaxID=68179 RepID=UPI0035DA26FC